MLVAVWIALALGVVGAIGGAVVAAARGFRTWRTLRRSTRAVNRGLGELTAKATATEDKAVAATANSAKLAAAVARLQESLAVLAVLRAAFSEATAGIGRVRGAVPRK